jgi:hypothetical protein
MAGARPRRPLRRRTRSVQRLRGGDLVRTLSGQVERGHYLFALDTGTDPARVVGYYGWALYPQAVAERFAMVGAPPPEDPGREGEVVWILTAAAEDRAAFFALAKAARARYPHHRVMAIRHKPHRRVLFDQWRARAGTAGYARSSLGEPMTT